MYPLSVVLGLSVTDLGRSIDWYRTVFELGPPDLEPVDGLVEFRHGPIWLQLVQSDQRPAGAKAVANFEVADVAAERDRLARLGVDVGPLEHVPGAIDYVEFADPDGNPLILHSTLEPATSEVASGPAAQVWGTVKARDARALIDFLVQRFGFVESAAFVDDGRIVHAQLDWPEGGGVMLGDARDGDGWTLTPGTAGFYVASERVEELYAAASTAGVTIHKALARRDDGSREFAVRDPEGNLWSFGSYRGEPRRTGG